MIIFDKNPQGTPEWLAARKGVCTGSRFKDARDRSNGLTKQQQVYVDAVRSGKSAADATAAAGYKKAPTAEAIEQAIAGTLEKAWGASALGYAMDLARERLGGTVPPLFQNDAMKTGSREEPLARVATESAYGWLIEEAGFAVTPDRKFGCSVDGLIDDDGVWECKTAVSSATIFKSVVGGDISEYRDQCVGAMWLLGRKYTKLTLWCPDLPKRLAVIHIGRDDDEIQALEDDLMAFERLVCQQVERLQAKMAVML